MQRHISYVIDSEEQIVQYSIVQYLFEGGKEVPVVLLPHGNTKRAATIYCQTQKSTLSRIKEVSGKPTDVVSQTHKEDGGVLKATSVSGLPHDRRQVYNNQQPTSKCTSGVDPLFELVHQCKIDLQPEGRKFIRSVTFETGTCCILASDSQLENVVRFCTNKGASCVLGVDPTFDLGKFYVTGLLSCIFMLSIKSLKSGPLSLVLCLFIQKRCTSRITIFSLPY